VNKELIINAAAHGVEIALLENKKLVELHSEKTDARFAVGDLYLGKVKKLIPGLNAAVYINYMQRLRMFYNNICTAI
jgi:ribonuclease G